MSRGKYYIPITRSGSSIGASVGTQIIGRIRDSHRAQLKERFMAGEIGRLRLVAEGYTFWFIVFLWFAFVFLNGVYTLIERAFQ